MSRELPVLFNAEMVQAILDERKEATRRIVKGFIPDDAVWGYTAFTPKGCISCRGTFADGYGEKFFKLPCEPGDILYVRETWAFLPCVECTREGTDCGRTCVTYEDRDSISDGCFVYRADHPHPEHVSWSPSIHMPKAATRIWLKVKAVRVERLQDMRPEDIRKEGMHLTITPNECKRQYDKIGAIYFYEEKRKEFLKIWNSTIKKSDLTHYGWDANPWVWVIEFERCGKPEGWCV